MHVECTPATLHAYYRSHHSHLTQAHRCARITPRGYRHRHHLPLPCLTPSSIFEVSLFCQLAMPHSQHSAGFSGIQLAQATYTRLPPTLDIYTTRTDLVGRLPTPSFSPPLRARLVPFIKNWYTREYVCPWAHPALL
ncbi:hypothetical protein OG21DRAFT_1270409 [Imleria badia]|nr:hypothetical protein OG21DRAFT_1270409 [Imleria badia]